MSPLMVSISGVRGLVGSDLTPDLIARWTAALSGQLPPGPIVLGRDSRPSGEGFASVAADLLASLGRQIWDLGIVPTPTVQLAVERWGAAGGLILTASHNPAEWNAMKFVGPDGTFLPSGAFEELRARVAPEGASFARGEGRAQRIDRSAEALALHRGAIESRVDGARIRERRPRVLLDCVHGAGGVLLPELLRGLGAVVDVLHEEPHGRFPREPEPTGPALEALSSEAASRGAAIALAVDPDADRCAIALPQGGVVGEEWTLPLVAAHLLAWRKGTVVTNLSTSTRLEAVAEAHGCRVERTPVGEAHVVARMRETRAVLGGEGNGGVIDPEVHLGRDAAVAAAWLLEAHATCKGGLMALASTLPPRYVLKAKLAVARGVPLTAYKAFIETLLGGVESSIDGLRWSRPDGFVHLRSSATEPILRLVVEASSEPEARGLLERILGLCRDGGRG